MSKFGNLTNPTDNFLTLRTLEPTSDITDIQMFEQVPADLAYEVNFKQISTFDLL